MKTLTPEQANELSLIRVSWYYGAKDNKGTVISINAALEMIGSKKYEDRIKEIRSVGPGAEKDELKRRLPGVTWSGFFDPTRAKNNLRDHSGLICIDIDKLSPDELDKIAGKLRSNIHTYALFTSPSGNGLKVLFVIQPDVKIDNAQHLSAFLYIQNYLRSLHGIEIDESGKDSSRLCFLSSDGKIYVNEECEYFTLAEIEEFQNESKSVETKAPKKVVKKSNDKPRSNTGEITLSDKLDKVFLFTNKKTDYVEGNRNNYIHLFACNACRAGIDEDDCIGYCLQEFYDVPEVEQKATIKSAYVANAADFGKNSYENFIANKKKNHDGATNNSNDNNQSSIIHSSNKEVNTQIKFWYVQTSRDRATGEEKEEIKFSYDSFIAFLEKNGFYRYDIGENFQFIRIQGKIVYNIDERKIRDFVFEYLRSNEDLQKVREMMRRSAKTYMSSSVLEGLKSFQLDIQRDTKNECFLFFKNGFMEITCSGYQMKDYSNLEKYVWEKTIIDLEYKPVTEEEMLLSDVYRFFSLAINKIDPKDLPQYQVLAKKDIAPDNENPLIIAEEEWKKCLTRLKSTHTGIGYMIHNYKDPSLTKAFTATDKQIGSAFDSNGGSGKSLTCKFISKVRPVCLVDGHNFKFDDQFCFSKYNMGDTIINFNDVRATFDFSKLFTMMTEEFNFRKMRMDTITVPFEDSPKMFISTNHTLKGEGSSYRRRQHIVEFTDFFNDQNSPQSYFGRQFFHDWDAMEYSRFYTCMANFVKKFLRDGLVDFPMENYAIRKIIQHAGEEFVDWCDAVIIPGTEYQKLDLLVQFKTNLPGHQFAKDNKTHSFTKALKMWADAKRLLLNAHKKDGRDKRGHVEFMTFTWPGDGKKDESTQLPF